MSISSMKLDTGAVTAGAPTVTKWWSNPGPTARQLLRVWLWSAVDMGCVADYNAGVYWGKPNEWIMLAQAGNDRFGTSGGSQNWQQLWDWKDFGIFIGVGESVILQANCAEFAPNQVFPGNPTITQAQAWFWLA